MQKSHQTLGTRVILDSFSYSSLEDALQGKKPVGQEKYHADGKNSSDGETHRCPNYTSISIEKDRKLMEVVSINSLKMLVRLVLR